MNKNVIVTFHEVNNKPWFEQTICFLAANYKIVSAEELYIALNRGVVFKNIANITIDDGHRSFYEIILPVLIKYKIPATLFVSPKIILEKSNFWFQRDKRLNQNKMISIISEKIGIQTSRISRFPYHYILKCLPIVQINSILDEYYSETDIPSVPSQNITIEQLIEADKSGLVTIGAHTMSHPVLSNESDKESEDEIKRSISELQSLLGHPVNYFAYPNGLPSMDFTDREIKYLSDKGIKLAFSGEPGTFNWHSNRLCLPRIGFSKGTPFFLRTKILMGPNWLNLKGLYSNQERSYREKIYNILNKECISDGINS